MFPDKLNQIFKGIFFNSKLVYFYLFLIHHYIESNMLRVISLLIPFLFVLNHLSLAQSNWQEQLDLYISKRSDIDSLKKENINTLSFDLKKLREKNDPDLVFKSLMKNVNAYEYFVYDSAFKYVQIANRLAYQLKDASKIAESKSKLSLIMLLKGLYTSSIDTINSVQTQYLSEDKKREFYSTAYRAYYDLSGYSRDKHYSEAYKRLGHSFSQKLIDEFKETSFEKLLGLALQSMVDGQLYQAENYYLELLNRFKLNDHETAIVTSGLGFIYSDRGDFEKAKAYLMQASIADIKSATKETTACRSLAELYYKEGNIDKAYQYILIAKADADFYGSEQRKFEISYILPLIESARFQKLNKEKKRITMTILVIGIISLLVLFFLIVILRQLRKLRHARQEIELSNKNLTQLNELLREASRIKEEYIGYYFNFSSQYIDKLEDFKKNISRQLITKSYDNIEQELKKYSSKNERKRLFEDFDRIFLKLFPDFVKRFNQLFDEKDGIHLKDDLSLNTDLRIFALIRIGVDDSEKIAGILNLSVNTIYTYKTKIRNRSIYPNEEFDLKVMAIKSV